MSKQITVDAYGRISREGLDELEIHVLYRATRDFNSNRLPFAFAALEAIAKALNLEVVHSEFEGESVANAHDPFEWLDCRYGSGSYAATPDLEDAPELRFVNSTVVKQVDVPSTGLSYKREKVDKDFPVLKLEVANGFGWTIYAEIINLFLETAAYRADIPHFRSMHERAALEVARRMGFRPVIVEESTE